MLISLNELRIKIADLEKEYNNKLYNLQGNAMLTKIKELNGKEETLSVPFNFQSELTSTTEIAEQLSKFKGLLSKANNTTAIDEIDTIQTAIAKLQEKRRLLDKIEYILSNMKEKTQRKVDGGYGNTSAYYEVTTSNFDKQKLTCFRDVLRQEINTLDVKVQDINNVTKVEI
ncbi:TPA: hypothetical protein N2D99_002203 [Clostridium botulinum]|nr:hypothetical protein [Clostridium botulinum]